MSKLTNEELQEIIDNRVLTRAHQAMASEILELRKLRDSAVDISQKFKCYSCDATFDQEYPDCPKCGDVYNPRLNLEVFEGYQLAYAALMKDAGSLAKELYFSCQYDESSGVDKWEDSEPEKQRYNLFLKALTAFREKYKKGFTT